MSPLDVVAKTGETKPAKPPKYLAVFCQCGNEVFRTLKRIADKQQNTTPLLAKQALKAHAKRDKCHGRFGKIALVEEAS